ncbi:AraC family transcriptional regulator [Parvibaculum sp.]|jgi:AraC-like DNA-binding protein|uniref:helix-turn-helix domain-containing protein n=1 Tax=Parvibaculum sp. TaxID=2024848 RepID=UPI001B06296B|nr:AraC family transcriptional regulator [Parvibaculum sp.]MBO6632975.1 helix-turn-helix transcriptional regulator [Parvibaculum sp.]MBO6677755.1 helix-turn-helix transcriptional regulator [Parvibaculum sp.]MBO6684752.1 helix-turn-helix transcriptional regulator [Parvibaculum sp.]MBO6906365.1 helix-turn-helix transcriptional regulator [Parvibaculum sp.]
MTEPSKSGTPGRHLAEIVTSGDVRADVRMDGVYFFRSFASCPVNKRLDPGDFSYCFMVRRGKLRLTIDFPEPTSIDLVPGSIVAVSGLAPHRFHSLPDNDRSSSPGSFPRVPISEQVDASNDVELLLGVVPSENFALGNLIVGPIHLSDTRFPECASRIWKAAELLDEEFVGSGEEYGQAIIVRRIAEIIVINMTRSLLADGSRHAPGVVKNRGVILAIRAFLDAPLESWSIDSLARQAGMSRTKFSEEFRRVVGRTPMQTLARMRLTLVTRKMLAEELSVEEAADLAGYSSSAAFIRAFSREFGATPFQWRKSYLANSETE